MQLPHLSALDTTPIYNMHAVVMLTDIAASRLRAWERRYGILAPYRRRNQYRLYSERDVAIIRWLRDQVAGGMAISQAIAYLQTTQAEGVLDGREPAPTPSISPTLVHIVPDLIAAALRLDERTTLHLLQQAWAIYPLEEICLHILMPVMQAIGQEWKQDQQAIIAEHFLTTIVRAQLEAIWQATYQSSESQQILVACVSGELHELGAFMLALLLRRSGLRVIFLGQNIEAQSFQQIIAKVRPPIVCLSVTLREHMAEARLLAEQLLAVPDLIVYLGGQGIKPEDLATLSPRLRCPTLGLMETVNMIRADLQQR